MESKILFDLPVILIQIAVFTCKLQIDHLQEMRGLSIVILFRSRSLSLSFSLTILLAFRIVVSVCSGIGFLSILINLFLAFYQALRYSLINFTQRTTPLF